MNNSLQKNYMELLDLLSTYIKESEVRVEKIRRSATPMDVFNMLEDIQKIAPQLDGVASKIESVLRRSKEETDFLLNQIRQQYTVMMSKISERENMEVPVNTSCILYNEDQLMKDIVIGREFQFEGTLDSMNIRDILIDEIVDPKDYSIVSIINRISMFSTIIDAMIHVVTKEYLHSADIIKSLKNSLLDLREIINSGDCMDALACHVWNDINKGFKARIIDAFRKSDHIFSIRKDYIHQFQVLNAMNDNMEIFQRAVGIYGNTVTESFFNPDSVYQVL